MVNPWHISKSSFQSWSHTWFCISCACERSLAPTNHPGLGQSTMNKLATVPQKQLQLVPSICQDMLPLMFTFWVEDHCPKRDRWRFGRIILGNECCLEKQCLNKDYLEDPSSQLAIASETCPQQQDHGIVNLFKLWARCSQRIDKYDHIQYAQLGITSFIYKKQKFIKGKNEIHKKSVNTCKFFFIYFLKWSVRSHTL